MPIIKIAMNVNMNEDKKEHMLSSIVHLVATLMKKPIKDVMVLYSYNDMIMANSFDAAAFVDLRFISVLDMKVYEALCMGILKVLKEVINIDSARLYINFFEVSEINAWRFLDGIPKCPGSNK
jgi:hypothetical protein